MHRLTLFSSKRFLPCRSRLLRLLQLSCGLRRNYAPPLHYGVKCITAHVFVHVYHGVSCVERACIAGLCRNAKGAPQKFPAAGTRWKNQWHGQKIWTPPFHQRHVTCTNDPSHADQCRQVCAKDPGPAASLEVAKTLRCLAE